MLIGLATPVAASFTLEPQDRLSLIVFSWYLYIPGLLIHQSVFRKAPGRLAILSITAFITLLEYFIWRSEITRYIIDKTDYLFNPQFLLYGVSIIALLVGIYSLVRKGYQLSLCFLLAGVLMSAGASTLFHRLSIQMNQDHEIALHNDRLNRVISSPQDTEIMCKALNWTCYLLPVEAVPELLNKLDLSNSGLLGINQSTISFPKVAHAWKVSSIAETDINANSQMIGYAKLGGIALVTFDKHDHSIRKTMASDIFAYLAMAFHAFWIPMLTFISLIHKRK
jgi:hypothetical protein